MNKQSISNAEQNRIYKLWGIWKLYSRNKLAVAGLAYLIILALASAFANVIFQGDPTVPNLNMVLQPPDWAFPFGTDDLGRSLLTLITYGGRLSLTIAFSAGGLLALIGTLAGLAAGYFGRVIDGTIMRIADIFFTLPTLPLILLVVALNGPSLVNVALIIAVTGWPFIARLVRSNVLSMMQMDFIQIEKVMGAGTVRIIFKHLLPNQLNMVLVYTSLTIPVVTLTEAAIEFLGLAPLTISWGFLLNTSMSYWVAGAWWLSFFPGLAIFSTSLAFYLISEGLKEALTPKLKRRRESLTAEMIGRK